MQQAHPNLMTYDLIPGDVIQIGKFPTFTHCVVTAIRMCMDAPWEVDFYKYNTPSEGSTITLDPEHLPERIRRAYQRIPTHSKVEYNELTVDEFGYYEPTRVIRFVVGCYWDVDAGEPVYVLSPNDPRKFCDYEIDIVATFNELTVLSREYGWGANPEEEKIDKYAVAVEREKRKWRN